MFTLFEDAFVYNLTMFGPCLPKQFFQHSQ